MKDNKEHAQGMKTNSGLKLSSSRFTIAITVVGVIFALLAALITFSLLTQPSSAADYDYSSSPYGTDFVTVWKTDINTPTDKTITINGSSSGGKTYSIDWGDGSQTNNVSSAQTHTYENPGEYTVRISGDIEALNYIGQSSSSVKLIDIKQWGTTEWKNLSYAFFSSSLGKSTNGTLTATDNPDTAQVTNMSGMFYSASAFNQPLNFDTSNVTDMGDMFFGASAFNQPLNFDTSNVTNMSFMFRNASAFNQPLNFDTSNVRSMSGMFFGASAFNQPLNLDTSNVTDMGDMFRSASAFNQPLNFDTSNVTNMIRMFYSASAFNQPLNFDTSNVTDMGDMFRSASAFNQPLNFDTSNVRSMSGMFFGASAFNQPLNFDTSNVTNMIRMFYSASAFNQPLNFDTSNVTSMSNMFRGASAFNQALNFDISNVTDMSNMLYSSKMSPQNYATTLSNWASQSNVPQNISLGASGRYYCNLSARQSLIEVHGWTITGDSSGCSQPSNVRIGYGTDLTTYPNIRQPIDLGAINANSGVNLSYDPENYQKLTYSLTCSNSGVNDNLFTISQDNHLVTKQPLAYQKGQSNTYTVCIKAANSAGLSTDQIMNITVYGPGNPYVWTNGTINDTYMIKSGIKSGDSIGEFQVNSNVAYQYDSTPVVTLTCGEGIAEVQHVSGQDYRLIAKKDLAYRDGGVNVFDVCLKVVNVHGGVTELNATVTIAGPKKVTDVTFFEDEQGRKMMTISGESFMAAEYEMYRLYFGNFAKLNGKTIPLCLSGTGMTAADWISSEGQIEMYNSAFNPELKEYFISEFGPEASKLFEDIPATIEETASDNPTCYRYYDAETETEFITNTEFTVWLDDDFDIEAEGTVSVAGSPTYTFNKPADQTGTDNTTPTVAVNGNKSINKKPTVPFKPTFSGVAEPGATVTVTVYSDPVTCTTTADSDGRWSCTLSTALPPGSHTVYVQVTNPDNTVENLGPYTVYVQKDGTVPPVTSNSKPTLPKKPDFKAPNTGFMKQVMARAVTPLQDVSVLRTSIIGVFVVVLLAATGTGVYLLKRG